MSRLIPLAAVAVLLAVGSAPVAGNAQTSAGAASAPATAGPTTLGSGGDSRQGTIPQTQPSQGVSDRPGDAAASPAYGIGPGGAVKATPGEPAGGKPAR